MKQRILFILKYYLFFVAVFVFQKPLFMLYEHEAAFKINEVTAVLWHGLAMDMTTAGYMTLVPLLLLWIAIWVKGVWIDRFLKSYSIVVLFINVLIFISDMELFGHWGFHMDSTALFYLKSPVDAAASVSYWLILIAFILILMVTSLLYQLMHKVVLSDNVAAFSRTRKGLQMAVFVPLFALLFLAIRGGVGVASMNVGRVYFSGDMFLNQAAINPSFNLFYSITHQSGDDLKYNFLSDEEAQMAFNTLKEDTTDTQFPVLLNTRRPNVIVIVLESFSAKIIGSLGGIPTTTPRFNALSKEGIFFTNYYANSFRTDRGLVALLSGTPSLPTAPLLKYPTKLNHLPSISGSLKREGYDLSLLYGGDINFANMRQFFVCSGFEKITFDENFPVTDRLSKWGVPDHVTFPYLYESIAKQQKQPFMKMFLTLSSHEPFEVPSHKFADPYLNAIAYTDSCLGDFIDKLKKLPSWKNTLVVMLADHSVIYPKTLKNENPERYRIPMLWLGGAIKEPMKIDTLAAQSDLAATLLGQLDIPAKDFDFSRNFLKKSTPKMVFFSYINGFGFVTKDNAFVYDCAGNKPMLERGGQVKVNAKKGKAFLQMVLKDFEKR